MWRPIQEALDYLQHYRGQTFVIKVGKQVALCAEEAGVLRNIERLRGHGVRMVVIHAVADLDVKYWPSLSLWADKRGIDNIQGIRACFLEDRVPVVYCGQGREESSDKHAAKLAVNLKADKLLFLTDRDGVPDSNGLLIRQLTVDDARTYLRQAQAGSDSIVEKLKCAVWAFEQGIDRAHIINGLQEDALFRELLTSEGIGTMIYGREPYVAMRRAEKKDAPMIIDIIRSGEFPAPADFTEVIKRTSSFSVRVYDDYVHGCVLYTIHKKVGVLELAYLVTSRIYEDAPDTEIIMREALEYAKKHDFKHVFMEAAKTQIWLGIYPWFLGMGFKRRRLRDVLPGKVSEREDAEVWYLHL